MVRYNRKNLKLLWKVRKLECYMRSYWYKKRIAHCLPEKSFWLVPFSLSLSLMHLERTVNRKTKRPLFASSISVSSFFRACPVCLRPGTGETEAAAMRVFWSIPIWMRDWRIRGTGIPGTLWVTGYLLSNFPLFGSFLCIYWICDVGFVRNSVLDVGFRNGKGFIAVWFFFFFFWVDHHVGFLDE